MREPDNYLPQGVSQSGNNLIINNASPDMSGTYACVISSPQGEIRKQIRIEVPRRPVNDRRPPTIYSANPREMNLRLGDEFKLTCEAEGNPLPSIRIETPTRYRVPQPESQAIRRPKPEATFHISHFTADNAGKYVCVAENEYGERATREFYVNLVSSGQAPSIVVEPKRIEAVEGSSLTINASYTVTIYLHSI